MSDPVPRPPHEQAAVRRKHVLMVAFHFPPQAGSSGVLRTLNFVKHLPANGWQATVLTAWPLAYAERRDDLLATVPAGTTVLRGAALDAARHLSIANKYPRLLALPDRWSSWWIGAVATGLRATRQQRPDLIWSTYPISTAHLIGATLSRLRRLPWVADFRDPMLSPDHPEERLLRKVWGWLESVTMRRATYCVFTTLRAAQDYAERYPLARDKCVVIENGYDESAFEGVAPVRHGVSEDTLLLLHSGLIYPGERNPSAFFTAVRHLLDRGRLDRNRLRIRFRASHHEREVIDFAKRHQLDDIVEVAPSIPYRQAIAEMLGADALLLFQGRNFNGQIPAKAYEYLRAQRPILAAVDPAGDSAALLRDFEHVALGDINDVPALEAALEHWLQSLSSPGLEQGFLTNLQKVEKYSRATQARRLASLFDLVV